MRRRLDGRALLLLTPVMWGATFPATKLALRRLPVLPFMAWTRLLGSLAILVLLPVLLRSGRGSRAALRSAILPVLVLGGLMFVGYTLQTEGQARTTATNAAFITALYVVFAPILAAIVFRQSLRRSVWVAVVLSVAGLTLLSMRDLGHVRFHAGDLLVLAGAVAWAGHINAISHLSPRHPVWMLSLGQMSVAGLLHLAGSSGTGMRLSTVASANVWPLLVITGVLGSGVAFTIQILAQREISATRAVFLLAGESIFSALFAAMWLGERLLPHQWIGASLVLVAMAFSELAARRPGEAKVDPAVP
jgi:drug/metabolite transporter (DMT)-like permease